jgi:hypothetical protein
MRIDSSGNLLVGQTTANSFNLTSGFGFDVRQTYGLGVAVQDNPTAIFNRTNTDGDIAQFRKDGTTVGSIQSNLGKLVVSSASVLKFQASSTNELNLDTTRLYPEADSGLDLGLSSNRFKDLYLSGGVYLGGTGAANKLDDYEEGTCTITIKDSNNNSATMGINVFRYVKIGSLVHLTGTLQWSSTSALNTSRIQIHGLPFTSAANPSGGTYRSPVSNGTSTSGSFTIPREEIAFGLDPNANFIWGSRATGNNVDDILTKSHLGTSGILYSLQAIYETDA